MELLLNAAPTVMLVTAIVLFAGMVGLTVCGMVLRESRPATKSDEAAEHPG